MLSELTADEHRNHLIARDVAGEVKERGNVCLVLSDRKAHCETLQGLLSNHGLSSEILTGDRKPEERRRVIEALNNGETNVLIATGQLIGEGFDCAGLSSLFLATPVRFDGRLLQYLGRVLRPAPGKSKSIVYDYVDANVGVLRTAARARRKVYG